MKIKIKEKLNFLLFFLLYLIFVISATPWAEAWWIKASFWIFSLFLAWLIGWRDFSKNDLARAEQLKEKWLLAPLGALFLTRLIPFLHYGQFPLGYDTGIYLKIFEKSFQEVQAAGFFPLDKLNPLTIISHLLMLFGWSAPYLISFFYLFLEILLGLTMYLAAKAYFNRSVAIFSVLLLTLSFSQFLAYWWFYWAMLLACSLTLAAFYLLKKKSWLVAPVAGLMGAVHPLSFLSFGLALVLYFIFSRERRFVFWAGLAILAIACSVGGQIFLGYLPNYTKNFGLIAGYPPYAAQELAGQFINFSQYRLFVLFYLPFALLGLARLIINKKFHYLFFYFLVNFSIIYFHLIFHNRYLILLDLVAIILAGETLFYFVSKLYAARSARLVLLIFLMALAASSFYQAWQAKPWVSKEELAEIKSLEQLTEPNSFIMAVSSYYAPWIYGFSNRRVIAPGMFEYNQWNVLKWQAFWTSNNQELRHQFLDEYQKPLYIFTGDRAAMDFSNDPGFVKIDKWIWRYIGN